MKRAVVFDWDGTIISCEGKVDLTVETVLDKFPLATNSFREKLVSGVASPGWIKNGFIASLDEDYFSHMFGLLSETLTGFYPITNDSTWSIILAHFKENYGKVPASALLDFSLLYELAHKADIYIVSNSAINNLLIESQRLGLNHDIVRLIGGAKKYQIESSIPSILNVPTNRPLYKKVLADIASSHNDVIVIGDNFSCDLALPLWMNWRVGYIQNLYSPRHVIDFLSSKNALIDSVAGIVETLTFES
jgi:FMN phosphatase YigB (HAD superfamily)